jgi:hypothetical protein
MNGKNKTTVQINRKKKSSEIDSITSLVYTNFPPCDNPKIERYTIMKLGYIKVAVN